MVDALHEVHRVLSLRGLLVDARPDSRVLAHVERRKARGFQGFGTIRTRAIELGNDRASDRAVARMVREGIFRRRRHGRYWHRVPFDTLAELRRYLREHLRFVTRADWRADAATRRRYAEDPFVIRRAVRYELLDRVEPARRVRT